MGQIPEPCYHHGTQNQVPRGVWAGIARTVLSTARESLRDRAFSARNQDSEGVRDEKDDQLEDHGRRLCLHLSADAGARQH